MGLLKKIELANNFSSVERILGKYVLENGEKVLNMSKQHLLLQLVLFVFVENLNMKDIMILKLH